MRISFAETLCKKFVCYFNEIQRQSAVVKIRQGSCISSYYISLQLLSACSTISNFRFRLFITDSNASVCVDQFDNLSDLIQYVHKNGIKLDVDLHKLSAF